MSSAKQEILDRIRNANRGIAQEAREAEYTQLERGYRQSSSTDRAAVVNCFIDRLHDYGSGVCQCAPSEIADTVASVLSEHAIPEILVSSGVPAAWRSEGVRFRVDHNLSYEEIDEQRAVLTGCAAAIALTGTIILQHGEARRALSLIPDYHLCVVFEEQVVETVPEAMRQIGAFGNAPLTTISGPSATADIEMRRIKGVHGPRSLDVILVRSPEP